MPNTESIYTALSVSFIGVIADLRDADKQVQQARRARDKAQRDAIKAIRLHRQATAIAGGPNAMADHHLALSQQNAKDTQDAYDRALVSAIATYQWVVQQWLAQNRTTTP